MKTSEFPVGHFLENDVQVIVPAYQRPYEWDEVRWIDFWRDVSHLYRQSATGHSYPPHFFGVVILETIEAPSGSPVLSFSAIDGQQRLVTSFLLACAIRDHVAHEARADVKMENEYSTIIPKYGLSCRRFIARPQDKPALDAVLDGKCVDEMPQYVAGTSIGRGYLFFRYQLRRGLPSVTDSSVRLPPKSLPHQDSPASDPDEQSATGPTPPPLDIPTLHLVLTKKLNLLQMTLENGDEESSVIFETMNSRGTPLRQFDLLRNSIFVRMPEMRETFYSTVWQPVETMLSDVTYRSLRADPGEQFLYEYLIAGAHQHVTRDALHRLWLNKVVESIGYTVDAENEALFAGRFAHDLSTSACLYRLAVGQAQSFPLLNAVWSVTTEMHTRIQEMMAMSGGPHVPLVLQVLQDRHSGLISDADALTMLIDLQSFLIRKILCGHRMGPMRALMMEVAGSVSRPLTIDRLRDSLLGAGWPSDAAVLTDVTTVDLDRYSSSAYFPLLRGIERQLAGPGAHPMPFGSGHSLYSVEHIFPQTDNVGPGWGAELDEWGASLEEMQQRRRTLGNLTAVTGYDNKKNGKKRFADKKPLLVSCAPLKLHQSVTSHDKWTPEVIDARTHALAAIALKEWPRPSDITSGS